MEVREDQLKSGLLVGSEDQTEVIRLGSRCSYLLSHLARPRSLYCI